MNVFLMIKYFKCTENRTVMDQKYEKNDLKFLKVFRCLPTGKSCTQHDTLLCDCFLDTLNSVSGAWNCRRMLTSRSLKQPVGILTYWIMKRTSQKALSMFTLLIFNVKSLWYYWDPRQFGNSVNIQCSACFPVETLITWAAKLHCCKNRNQHILSYLQSSADCGAWAGTITVRLNIFTQNCKFTCCPSYLDLKTSDPGERFNLDVSVRLSWQPTKGPVFPFLSVTGSTLSVQQDYISKVTELRIVP